MSDHNFKGEDGDVIELSAVVPSEVRWIFPGWIPIGKISLIHGPPGYRKTGIALDLAARASVGGPLPLSTERFEPMNVLLMALEDGLEDTVQPLLVAAGADLSKIAVLAEVENTIPRDIGRVEAVCKAHNSRLVIIDYMDDCLSSGCSTQNTDGIRRAMKALATMAERLGLGVLIVRHEVKAQRGLAIHRSRGSIVIAGTARSVMTVTLHPRDPNLRVLTSVKLNGGPKPKSLVFEVVSVGKTSRVNWIEEVDLDADDLADDQRAHTVTARSTARGFLEAQLAAGPVAAKDVFTAAAAVGIVVPTLKRTKKLMGICSERGRGDDHSWYWHLSRMGEPAQDAVEALPEVHGQHVQIDPQDPLGSLATDVPPHPELSPLADQQEQLVVPTCSADQEDQGDHVEHDVEEAADEGDDAAYVDVDTAVACAMAPDVLTPTEGLSDTPEVAPDTQPGSSAGAPPRPSGSDRAWITMLRNRSRCSTLRPFGRGDGQADDEVRN